ncbi:MAG: flagellar protein FlgN [Oscillospiraceae bacterium]|nr:flagellar protein FlgN [Oscillospiraceae bacterium]
MEKLLAILTEIEQLTLAQRGLIAQGDLSALAENLERKEGLIQALGELPPASPGGEARALLERIAAAESENVKLARDEMKNLRALMKKTREGKTTVRGYDALSSGVGATYIDKKQ